MNKTTTAEKAEKEENEKAEKAASVKTGPVDGGRLAAELRRRGQSAVAEAVEAAQGPEVEWVQGPYVTHESEVARSRAREEESEKDGKAEEKAEKAKAREEEKAEKEKEKVEKGGHAHGGWGR